MQEHYYAKPPQIERGWRHHLMSTAGRTYLDMVNNVTVLGHAHPRVAETAARQLRQAEHELALQLRGGGRVQRAAGRDAARTAGHRIPGEFRLGGKRFGAPAGDGRDRQTRCRGGARGIPRVDVCHRRRFHIDGRQPECACHPPGLGAYGGIAEQLPRQVPRRRRRPVRGRGGRPDRGPDRRRPRTGCVHRGAGVRQRGRNGAAGPLSGAGLCGGARGRRPGHRR